MSSRTVIMAAQPDQRRNRSIGARTRLGAHLALALVTAVASSGCVLSRCGPFRLAFRDTCVTYPDPEYYGHYATCWKQWPEGWGCPIDYSEMEVEQEQPAEQVPPGAAPTAPGAAGASDAGAMPPSGESPFREEPQTPAVPPENPPPQAAPMPLEPETPKPDTPRVPPPLPPEVPMPQTRSAPARDPVARRQPPTHVPAPRRLTESAAPQALKPVVAKEPVEQLTEKPAITRASFQRDGRVGRDADPPPGPPAGLLGDELAALRAGYARTTKIVQELNTRGPIGAPGAAQSTTPSNAPREDRQRATPSLQRRVQTEVSPLWWGYGAPSGRKDAPSAIRPAANWSSEAMHPSSGSSATPESASGTQNTIPVDTSSDSATNPLRPESND